MSAFARRLQAVVRRLRPVARPHRRWLLFGSLGTLLVVACRLALPWPLKGVVDLAIEEDARALIDLQATADERVYWLAGAFVAIAVAQGLGELVQRLSFARFAIGLIHDARAEALGRLQREGAGGRDPGDLIARVVGDSGRLKSGLKGVLIRFTQNGTFFVGVCAMLLVIEPLLGAVFVAGGSVILGVAAFGASRVARISRRLRRTE
ncbi:MAG: ABC transporter transmembrane domain-containing protein, partial [Solirubrobacteraceae bacterium]